MLKKLILIVLLLALVGGIVAYYQWNKPHQKVEDMQGMAVDAAQLCNDFAADDAKANTKYAGKVLDVSGTVAEVQNNGKLILLKGPGDVVSVQCNMRDSGNVATAGNTIVIRGFFSDNGMFGPALTDCVIKNGN